MYCSHASRARSSLRYDCTLVCTRPCVCARVCSSVLNPPCLFPDPQVVSLSELTGADHPLEIVYFVEGPSGQRVPAVQSAELLNSLDVQRAAIVLGHRVQGILAQREYLRNTLHAGSRFTHFSPRMREYLWVNGLISESRWLQKTHGNATKSRRDQWLTFGAAGCFHLVQKRAVGPVWMD